MILDTSVIVAKLFDEPGRRAMTEAIAADPVRLMSTASVFESAMEGRHPAGLNFGDCCADALAAASGSPTWPPCWVTLRTEAAAKSS